MNAYAYNAALWCGACARLISPDLVQGDEIPTGPYPDGGGAADTPAHCDGCGVHLGNDLTAEGYRYVGEAIQAFAESGAGQGEVIREWLNAYPDAFDAVLHRDVTRALLALRESPAPFRVKHAECEPPFVDSAPPCDACLEEQERAGWAPAPRAEFLFPDNLIANPPYVRPTGWRLLCTQHAKRYPRHTDGSIVWASMFRLLRVS